MFGYLIGPVIKLALYSLVLAAVLTYTPLGRWGFQLGIFDAIFDGIEKIAPPPKKFSSLEEFGNKLTGSRSELIYGSQTEPKKKENAHKK